MSFPFVVVTPGQEAAGQVSQITSQDTFASVGAPLTVIGSGGGGPTVIPANLVVSTLNAATSVSTSVVNAVSLLNVSTINGAAYVAGGGVPANLVVSTLNAATSVSTSVVNAVSLLNISSINGAPYTEGGVPQNVFVSSLNFLDNPGFINFPLPSSIASSVTFNMYGEYIDEGAGSYLTTISMNADVVELAGELQFGSVNSIITSQSPAVGFGVPASISSLIGVSSINGVNWAVLSTLAAGA
jgi:hypothetical protein